MDLQELGALGEFLGGLAVIGGVAFAVVQLRQDRARRQREAALALMGSLRTPDMLRALMLLDALPPGLSKAELEQRVGPRMGDVQMLLGTWESLGILVFRREVGLDMVDDFYSASVLHSWLKLRGYVEGLRAEVRRETRWEWFQWLAERMAEREAAQPPRPAHVAHRAWVP